MAAAASLTFIAIILEGFAQSVEDDGNEEVEENERHNELKRDEEGKCKAVAATVHAVRLDLFVVGVVCALEEQRKRARAVVHECVPCLSSRHPKREGERRT